MMSSQLITCTKCGKSLPFTMFYRDRKKANGRHSWCRKCTRDYNSKRAKARRRLKIPYGVAATYQGKRYAAVYVAPHGFTPEATRQALEASQ